MMIKKNIFNKKNIFKKKDVDFMLHASCLYAHTAHER
jgi:hypothetical protein